MAVSCLMHCSIMVCCHKVTLNGKNRPNVDTRRNGCLEIEVHESDPFVRNIEINVSYAVRVHLTCGMHYSV